MINGYLTLFVLACHWLTVLPVTEVFYFLYSASHTHRNILNTSSITSAENLLIITQMIVRAKCFWQAKCLDKLTSCFFREGFLFRCFFFFLSAVRNLVYLTFPLWSSTQITFYFSFCYKSLSWAAVGIHRR